MISFKAFVVVVTAVFGLTSADFVGLDAQQLARVGRQQDDGAVQVQYCQKEPNSTFANDVV